VSAKGRLNAERLYQHTPCLQGQAAVGVYHSRPSGRVGVADGFNGCGYGEAGGWVVGTGPVEQSVES
jgi:hypothetical protein